MCMCVRWTSTLPGKKNYHNGIYWSLISCNSGKGLRENKILYGHLAFWLSGYPLLSTLLQTSLMCRDKQGTSQHEMVVLLVLCREGRAWACCYSSLPIPHTQLTLTYKTGSKNLKTNQYSFGEGWKGREMWVGWGLFWVSDNNSINWLEGSPPYHYLIFNPFCLRINRVRTTLGICQCRNTWGVHSSQKSIRILKDTLGSLFLNPRSVTSITWIMPPSMQLWLTSLLPQP